MGWITPFHVLDRLTAGQLIVLRDETSTMISLRSLAFIATGLAALTSAGCTDATNPTSANRPQIGRANLTASVAKSGVLDARVLLDKSGNATLDVHTGTYDDKTNAGVADGTFSSLLYTVTNSSKKQVLSKTVTFSHSGITKYSTAINLCSSSHDDDDDDDGHSPSYSSCSTHIGAGWTVSVQGTLKGVGGGDKKTDVAPVNANIINLPDVDLTQQGLFVIGTTGAQTAATTVAASIPTTFSVNIPNNKPIAGVANTVGAQSACIVMVDGWPQIPFPNGQYNKYTNPNAFGYVNDPTQDIAAGAIASCQFKLSLPAGTHKIVVNATVLWPGDYDVTNNSTTTFTVTAGAVVVTPPVDVPVDVAAQSLQRAGNGVNASTLVALDTAGIGRTTTIKASFVNASARATAIDCIVTALWLNVQPVGATTNVAIAANGGVGVCQYTVSSSALGTFPITVTGTPTSSSPADPNAANNSVSGTLTVRSTGAFTDTHGGFNVYQDWTNPASAGAWPIATSLDHQVFQVSQLSLLIVPSQAILGTFALKATTTSGSGGSVSFGTGTVPATALRAAGPGELVCITTGPAANLGNAVEPALGYFAQVCTQQASQPGFQQISVNYTQSVSGLLPAASSLLLFSSNVTMKVQLDFTLVGSAPDKVTATVVVPVTNQAGNCSANNDPTAQSCSTQFGTAVVTTP